MQFSIGCSLDYRVTARTSFVFAIEAAGFERQKILRESLGITPQAVPDRFTMPESGNRYVRITAEPGDLHIDYTAEIDVDPHYEDPAAVAEIEAGALPLAVLPHLNPSRYCQSDKLKRFANRQFGDLEPGYSRVAAICNWIHDNVDYVSGSSDTLTSAFDTVTERAGVCRDFAHLGIALCRAIGIPARYVSCYAWRLDPPDFHAVFEAYLQGPAGGGWYLFDPTRKAGADRLVRIAIGRDAAEVSFATIFGQAESKAMAVRIEAPGAPAAPPPTLQAVTLSAV